MVLVVKNPPANARDTKDLGLSPVSGRSLGEGNGNLPGASTGVPTHDKVMWESPDGQGESGLKGAISGLPEHLPQNQNLSVLLFYNFHQLL